MIYKNLYTPIKIICPIHGEFYQNPSDHLAGCDCQKCHPQKRRRTNEEFIKEAMEIHGDKYDYSRVDYKDCYTRVEIICPKHGVFWQRPVEHINKNRSNGCPKCGYNRKTNKEFIDIANRLHDNKYTYDIEYTDEKFISTAEKIDIICPIHGLFYQSAGNHIYEDPRSKEPNGCPKCAPLKSKTEERIERFLKKNDILYQSQKIFIGCFYKNALRFDFYLPDYNLCIEYQGEQHFKCIDYFGGEENFKKSLERDSIKRKYCEENNIFLLEIPYNIGNIDDVNSYILYILKNIEEKNIFEYDISNWRLSRQFERSSNKLDGQKSTS